MSEESLLVTLGVSDKGASTQIKALNKELKYLDNEFKTASKGSKNFESTTEGLSTKLSYLEKKYEANNTKLKSYKEQFDKASESVKRKESELEKLKNSEEDNTQAIAKAEKQLGTYKDQMLNAGRNINLTELEMKSLTNEIKSTNTALENVAVEQYKKKIESLATQLETTGGKISNVGKKMNSAGTALTVGVTMPLLAAGTAAVKYGSDLEESINKVDAIYKGNADEIIAWSETTLDTFGISNASALEYASTMGDLLKGIGFDDSKLVGMSKTIIGMSSDIASFKNSSPEEVFSAISASLTGEREQLKKYGYVITDAILNEYALSEGYSKTYTEMNLQERALLTLSKIQDYATDAQGDFAKTSDGNANSSKIFKESLKELASTFGQDLLPSVTPVIQEATKLVKKFGDMDEGTRQNIIKFGMFAAALGPVTKVLGATTSGIGSLVTHGGNLVQSLAKNKTALEKFAEVGASAAEGGGGIGKLGTVMSALNPTALAVGAGLAVVATGVIVAKKNADLMNESITYSSDEMSGLERTLSKFNGTNVKTKQELIDSGLIYKDFSKNISPEFQKAVQQSTTDVNEFALMLGEITFDGVMSEEENAELNTRVDNALSNAIATIKGKQEESSKAMNELFMSDSTINENEQKILEFYSKNAETSVAEVNTLGAEIKDLQAKINASNSQEEIAQLEELIKTKYTRIKELELEYVGNNAEEVAYAKNEFSARANSIDLEDASALMVEKAKLRNDEVVSIKASYDTQIEMLKGSLDGMDAETRAAAETEITNLTAERDKKIGVEQGLYEEYLNILGEKNPKILAQINKFNGEKMSTGDQNRAAELAALKASYEDINKATEDGLYTMYNSTTSTWDKVQVKVDSVTGEVVGMTTMVKTQYGYAAKETVGYTQQITDAMNRESSETISTRNGIIKSLGEQIAKLGDVDVKADGTRVKIATLNGQKVEVQVSKDGTIRNLNEIINKISNIKDKTVTMTIVEQRRASQASQGYATGTINATKGFHLVGEEGPEIMYFNGGETVLTAAQTRDVMTSGGYFNADSVASRELINTTNNYNNYNTNNSSGSNIDYNIMAQSIAQAVAQAMQNVSLKGDVRLDSNAIVGTVSNGFAMAGKRVR